MYRKFGKRALDAFLALCGIVCLSWLLLGLAVAIKLDSPGPVFFKQKRVGIHKTHFMILKFRTMRSDTPHDMVHHPGGAFPAENQPGRTAPAVEHPGGGYGGDRPPAGAVEPV